jgi:hypothetical protein
MTARPLQLITSGQRRVADVRLAAELEIDPPRRIRCWIALHKRQLQQTGGYLHFTVSDRVKEYFLNSDQALLCLMQANTRKAADLRIDLVEMLCDRKRPAQLLALWQKVWPLRTADMSTAAAIRHSIAGPLPTRSRRSRRASHD